MERNGPNGYDANHGRNRPKPLVRLLAYWAPSKTTLPLAGAAETLLIPNTPKPTAMKAAITR